MESAVFAAFDKSYKTACLGRRGSERVIWSWLVLLLSTEA